MGKYFSIGGKVAGSKFFTGIWGKGNSSKAAVLTIGSSVGTNLAVHVNACNYGGQTFNLQVGLHTGCTPHVHPKYGTCYSHKGMHGFSVYINRLINKGHWGQHKHLVVNKHYPFSVGC
mgnify:CR=1 FL=1|jgi:hypothetical protein